MTGRLRLAVFDCDGTLVDSQNSIVAGVAAAWASEGLAAPSAARVRRVVGLRLDQAIARLAPDADAATQGRLTEAYKAAFRRRRDEQRLDDPLYPGIAGLLDALEAGGWLLGVATGKSRFGLDRTLAAHGLGDRFVTLQTPDVAAGKPDPEMLHRAMAETGAEPADVAMIGDTTYDMTMAVRAGVRPLGVDWGYHEAHELGRAGAEAVVASTTELLDLLLT